MYYFLVISFITPECCILCAGNKFVNLSMYICMFIIIYFIQNINLFTQVVMSTVRYSYMLYIYTFCIFPYLGKQLSKYFLDYRIMIFLPLNTSRLQWTKWWNLADEIKIILQYWWTVTMVNRNSNILWQIKENYLRNSNNNNIRYIYHFNIHVHVYYGEEVKSWMRKQFL